MRTFGISRNFLVGILAVSLTTFACSDKKQEKKGMSEETAAKTVVVAKVGEGAITVEDFKGYMSERSRASRRGVTKETATKLLDEMIMEEVLYQEALRLELDQDPMIKKRIRQMFTQKLMEKNVNRKAWNTKVDDKEVQEYYEKHKHEFNRPEQLRLADIYVAIPADADDKQRAELKKKAETALANAKKTKSKRSGFHKLIREYSDKHAKYTKGDTGYFDKEGKPAGIPAAIVEAGFKLKGSGDIADQLIETPDGYHIIMMTGRRSAINKDIARVSQQLKHRIQRESMKEKRQEYIDELKKKAGISIEDCIVDEIAAEFVNSAEPRPSMPGIPPRPSRGPNSPPRLPGH